MVLKPQDAAIRFWLFMLLGSVLSACGASTMGSGVAAKRICTEVFLADRDPGGSFADETAIVMAAVDLDVDTFARTVTARTMGMGERTAVWRRDGGCLLLPPETQPAITSFDIPPRPGQRSQDVPVAVDERIAAAIAPAFERRDLRTRAVVVLREGRLKGERYAPGFGPETPMLGWSLSKSATHALIGVAIRNHGFDPQAPVKFPEWAADGRAAITSEHLLRMVSGLKFDESQSLWNDVNTMLFLTGDMATFSADRPLAHPPGEHWYYASGSSVLLHRVLRDRLGDATYHRFPREALFDPISADSAFWETDITGTFVGSSYLYMSARDWSRLGQLYLQDGIWNGERLLPEGWAAHACTPTPASNGRYGAHWWINDSPGSKPGDRAFPTLPGDMCWAAGFEQQWVILVPSHDLVIVRLGVTPHTVDFDLPGFVTRIMDAVR